MGKFRDVAKGLKQFKDRYTHELPTGPHTDVKKHRLNPSLLDKSIESGRTKERKRKRKVMGMGLKNVLKRMVGQKEGGRIGKQHGGRTNLLEELGRVEAEPSNRNRRAEVSRIHGELNRGYKDGGSPHTKDRRRPPRKKFIYGISSGEGGGWKAKSEGIKRGHKAGGRAGFSMAGKVSRDAKKAVSNLKEKQKAAKGITKKAADALQKHIQTKNVKRLTTTGGAYKKRAAGGRIGLKHGTSPQQHYLQHGYGPTKARLRTGKPKIAKKGWA